MDRCGAQLQPKDSLASSHPIRACLSGEDLDWLGGHSVCVALDLRTTVHVGDRGANPAEGEPIPVEPWAINVWNYLCTRTSELDGDLPRVVARTQGPLASGLSSSAALILGLFEALASCSSNRIPFQTLVRWAYEFEFAIFNGGGMDHMSIMCGGATLFQGREQGLPELIGHCAFPNEWSVLVVDSRTRKDTKDHVRCVRHQVAIQDPALTRYVRAATDASDVVWSAICAQNLAVLSEGIELAHAAMREHQSMSTPWLEQIREIAWEAARLRLKVSGAGGGGALVGVCARSDAEAVVNSLARRFGEEATGVHVRAVDTVAPRGSW